MGKRWDRGQLHEMSADVFLSLATERGTAWPDFTRARAAQPRTGPLFLFGPGCQPSPPLKRSKMEKNHVFDKHPFLGDLNISK